MSLSAFQLNGKTTLVIGSRRGLGTAIAFARFQPGGQHVRFEALGRTEFETFRCTVFLGLFKRRAFGITPNALGLQRFTKPPP